MVPDIVAAAVPGGTPGELGPPEGMPASLQPGPGGPPPGPGGPPPGPGGPPPMMG